MKSLQDTFSPGGICFGCGPKNNQGLQIKSFVEGQSVVANFLPKTHHQAFVGVLSGGIVGTILDCHSNWAAAHYIMQKRGESEAPCTVTAHFKVNLFAPTPIENLRLVATPEEVSHSKATIKANLFAGDKVCADLVGLFVAVKEGHPAFHRW